jgi:dihydropyrimidine dehydrogenase (NAD+) subunit PreA
MGIDIDNFIPYPSVGHKSTNGGYCGPAVKPIAMNMVKNCALDHEVNIPISAIGGVETWRDAVEFLLVGAGSVQVCTSVMHYGFGIVREIISGLENYMDEKGFKSVSEIIGKALPNICTWENLDMNYKIVAHIDEKKCIGCQLCYIGCEDGAHQSIALSEAPSDRVPKIIEENCVGCNLCSLICPVENCITMVRKDENKEFESWKDRTQKGKVPMTFDDDLAGGLHHPVPEPVRIYKKE